MQPSAYCGGLWLRVVLPEILEYNDTTLRFPVRAPLVKDLPRYGVQVEYERQCRAFYAHLLGGGSA